MRYPGEIARTDYDAHEGERWSHLRFMRLSPLHYQHARKAKHMDSNPLRIGSALHAMIFEPETYEERFVVYREDKNKGEGARTKWKAFQEEVKARSMTILDADEEARALGMARAIARNPDARQYIAPSLGRAEIPITWTDERTGLICKMRADWITLEGLILDLKSARSADVRAFGRQAWNLGYFHQADFYARGLAAVTGRKVEEVPFLFVVAESEAPHDSCVFCPCDETRYAAHEEVDKCMDTLMECQRTGVWPGRYQGVQQLKAPTYVLMSEDEDWNVSTSTEGV